MQGRIMKLNKEYEIQGTEIVDKINELVDAVTDLQLNKLDNMIKKVATDIYGKTEGKNEQRDN